MSLSLSIVLDTRRAKKLGKYPVKLRLVLNRTPKDYQTIFDLTKEEYSKFSAPRISNDLHDIRSKLQNLEKEANQFASEMKPFTPDGFEQFVKLHPLLINRKKKNKGLGEREELASLEFDFSIFEKRFPIFDEKSTSEDYISVTFISYIKGLLEEERIGTALSYQNAYLSLKKFSGNVPFAYITKQYLVRYEKWMVKKNSCTMATVGINLRALRAMFNEAISGSKIISRDIYPFGRRKYRIPTNKSKIQALTKEELKVIFEYIPENVSLRRGKAYWFFCYFGNGMNPSDMANLKYKDIQGNYIKFIRNKTKQTTKENPKVISVFLHDKIKSIIDEWGNEDRSANNFIFPVLDHDMNVVQEYSRIRTFTKFLNDTMTSICLSINFTKKANNKICRKSTAVNLKRSGASTEFVQDTLGHLQISTTEAYLEDYEDDVKEKFSLLVSSF